MAAHSDTEGKLRDLADRFRSAQITRRELLQRAGLLVGGSALASFLAATSPADAATASKAAAAQQAGTKEQPKRGGTLKVGIFGEAPSLDPQFSTATITRNLSSHMFEGLFCTDMQFRPKLDLAETYEMTRDGKTATFTLHKGITFHNGKEMTSADVAASLRRFGSFATRGKPIGARVDDIKARDKYTVVMTFKQPAGRLPLFLAHQEEIIMPEEIANKYMKEQLKEFVGTGPFKFVERQPDRFTRFARFENYAARSGEPDGWVGRKTVYLDELLFIPVPEDAVRADGVITGEYHFGELLNPDSYDSLKSNPNVNAYIVKPYYWCAIHLNKKQGLFTDLRMRKALKLAIDLEPGWRAAWGPPEFWRLQPAMGSPETAWYTEVTKGEYNKKSPDQAKALLKEAGYKGETVRWLTTREYSYNYAFALATKPQLEAVGMKVDLDVVDWATLIQRRAKPELWDIFVTGHDTPVHPLLQPFMNSAWPGWWDTPEKTRIYDALFAEVDDKKAQALVEDMERLVMREVPYVKIGEYFVLRGARKELKGYVNPVHFFFWGCWLA
jgi:peptide/nickel transport system substrate-binding protein